MKKGWIIAIIVFALVLGIGLMIMLMIMAVMGSEPAVDNKSVLVLELSGELPEAAPAGVPLFLEPAPVTFYETVHCIRQAARDSRVAGILIRLDSPLIGWAKIQELQDELDRFKKSGKFIYAHAEVMNEADYSCVLPADGIFLAPEAFVEFNGFTATATFLKDMFNKIGIEPEVENIGKYKSAGDMLKRNSMSDAHREEMNALLDSVMDDFTRRVSRFRPLSGEEVRALLEEGISTPEDAKQRKLVDDVLYADEVDELIRKKTGSRRSYPELSIRKYRHVQSGDAGGVQMAVLNATGTITRGSDSYSPVFGSTMGSGSMVEIIRQLREQKSVKAVIVRIDSPGGDGLASDLIWRELQLTDQVKPVIASMSDVAASGGYYIAMGCRKIVAQPGTITGSVGVVSAKFNLKGLYDWMGLRFETIKRGRWADQLDSSRGMTPEEWERFRIQTRRFYDHFVQKAAKGRNLPLEEMETAAQGRVWTGTQALQMSLVDELGGLETAVKLARQEARLAEDVKIRLVQYPVPKRLLDQIVESLANPDTRILEKMLTPLPRRELRMAAPYFLPGPKAILAVMPYQIQIQ